ncbi:MAG: ABC transporter permease [Clostridiales bacterium]|jgi:simple sugar transport system permease protein|nr:ABC transporter permease [Eubacteriales bacterium]MDH7565779.1 ABC transporter permease [Clostridiales bacterium]
MKNKNVILSNIYSVLLPVIIALFIGGIIIAAIGENPFLTYQVMIQKSLFSAKGILKTLHFAAPLILTGLAIAITFKANIFNMGVEGAAVLGAFFTGVVGFSLKGVNPVLHVTLCLLTGMLVGIIFTLIPAVLKAYFKVNEMVVTLMLNYVVAEVVKFLAQGIFKDPASGYVSTYAIAESAMFKKLFNSDLTLFFFIALLVFGILYVIFKKSKLGFEITAIGKNPEFAEAAGMNVAKKIVVIMLISGAVSGLAGAGFLMSEKYRFTLDFSGSPGLGWDGMLIALLGNHSPIGVFVASVFYAALKTGSEYIGLFTNVPKDIVGVIQGILILCLSVKFVSRNTGLMGRWTQWLGKIRSKRENAMSVDGREGEQG